MDLRSLLAAHPGFRLAGEKDGPELLRFFAETPMRGKSLSLRYERDPDFFSFLRMQSPDSFVLVGESSKSQSGDGIGALGTLSVRPGMIDGKKTTVGYLGDLRLGFDRKLMLKWRGVYGELLARSGDLLELKGCRHFLTAVIDENKAALLALTAGKNAPYHYRELARYRMVNLLGRKPWWAAAPDDLRVQRGSREGAGDLLDFLVKENRDRAFGFCFPDELTRRLQLWPGLKHESFFVAHGKSGEVLGCFAPWSPSPAKKIVVERMPTSLRALCLGMRALRGDAPAIGRELKVIYLTHLEIKRSLARAERQAVLLGLLNHAYRAGVFRGAHLVSFADFDAAPLSGGLGSYWTQQTPMTLYQVLPHDRAEDPELLGIGALPPAFEMALV